MIYFSLYFIITVELILSKYEGKRCKNAKKIYEEQEIVISPYYKKDQISTIEVISDIHYHKNVNKSIFKILVEHCRQVKPKMDIYLKN